MYHRDEDLKSIAAEGYLRSTAFSMRCLSFRLLPIIVTPILRPFRRPFKSLTIPRRHDIVKSYRKIDPRPNPLNGHPRLYMRQQRRRPRAASRPGCMDSKLRIWNILEGKVMRWIQAPSVITSASFCPGGMFPVAFVFDGVGRLCSIGLVDGQVIFYYTDGLRYFTQVCYLLVILTHRLNAVIIMAKIVKDEKCALLLISVTVLAIRFLFLRMIVV